MDRWTFKDDMNWDGVITISDVWLWAGWVYHLPGDGLLFGILTSAPGWATFFEISRQSYGGILSGIVSFFCWILAFYFVAGALEVISEIGTALANFHAHARFYFDFLWALLGFMMGIIIGAIAALDYRDFESVIGLGSGVTIAILAGLLAGGVHRWRRRRIEQHKR